MHGWDSFRKQNRQRRETSQIGENIPKSRTSQQQRQFISHGHVQECHKTRGLTLSEINIVGWDYYSTMNFCGYCRRILWALHSLIISASLPQIAPERISVQKFKMFSIKRHQERKYSVQDDCTERTSCVIAKKDSLSGQPSKQRRRRSMEKSPCGIALYRRRKKKSFQN